jgi:hypothetical protein
MRPSAIQESFRPEAYTTVHNTAESSRPGHSRLFGRNAFSPRGCQAFSGIFSWISTEFRLFTRFSACDMIKKVYCVRKIGIPAR